MKTSSQKKNISDRERLIGYLYVMLLFLLVCVICGYSLVSQDNYNHLFAGKSVIVRKMERLKDFRRIQSENVAVVDSLFNRINEFSPGINASYEENDIRFLINDLSLLWEQNSRDQRYKVFMHLSAFYEIWLADKKELWSHQENLTTFRKNLEECEIGLQKKQEVLGSRSSGSRKK